MFLILKLFLQMAHETFVSDKGIDPRTKGSIFISSPWPGLSILVAYILFVLKIGPALMKDRKPYDLKFVISIYNVCQVVMNAAIVALVLYSTIMSENFSIVCQPIDHTIMDRYMQIMLKGILLYYFTKYVDLLDSIFFVLRKKTKQLSFLHIYHHTVLVSVSYLSMRYYAGSHVMVIGTLNAFVHVVMYFYYFLTSWKPDLLNLIWWKQYLTLLQLVQFVFGFIHFALPLLQPNCKVPTALCFIGMTQAGTMIVMFSDFYMKAYIRPKKKANKLQ